MDFIEQKKKQNGSYFGPYPNASAVRETLSLLQKVFKVRQCEDSYFRNRSRPCLQYQIKRCKAPCVSMVSEEEYDKDVQDTVQFLSGKKQSLQKSLEERMQIASSLLEFEQAAEIRDKITYLKKVQERQSVAKAEGNADIIGYIEQSGRVCFNVLFVRYGMVIGSKNYFPDFKLDHSEEECLDWFLVQFYINLASNRDYPREIIIPLEKKEISTLQQEISCLAGRKVLIKSSVRGDRLNWQKLAHDNARENLKTKINDKTNNRTRITQLQQLLSLPDSIETIECFDISHTMGEATVASCVVFGKEGPLKHEYRRFNINNITDGDDYAATGQALRRRYQKISGDRKKPSLILIDGGKGQLGIAETIMAELNMSDIPMVGVAKGVTRKPGMETLLYQGKELLTEDCDAAVLLIQQVRDEAHRFAIAGHRMKRQKARNRSVLEDIPGIGSKRRTALINYFGGREGVLSASIEALAQAPGISKNLAQIIYDFIHDG